MQPTHPDGADYPARIVLLTIYKGIPGFVE